MATPQILNLRAPATPPSERPTSPSASSDLSGSSGSSASLALVQTILRELRRTEEVIPGSSPEDAQFKYAKEIPTMVLYDDRGLDIYDEITKVEDYYLYGSELAILQKHGNEIARQLFSAPLSSHTTSEDEPPALVTDSSSEVSDEGSPERLPISLEQDERLKKERYEHHRDEEDDLNLRKEKWGDSAVGRNNYGVNGNFGLEPSTNHSTGSVIELGAGSLKKTSVLLRALSNLIKKDSSQKVNYYALDLEYGQLVSTLNALVESESDSVTQSLAGEEGKILAKGICASYDDAMPYLKSGQLDEDVSVVHDEPKVILFLGSSIGNYSRPDAKEFLKKISNDAMSVGDSMIIGIDSNNDVARIERAYNDTQGVTREFILNGVDHVGRLLNESEAIEGETLRREDFEYVSRYNKREGRHEAYLKSKRDITLSLAEGEPIHFSANELIAIERSYKYTTQEALELFASAGLRLVSKWTDDDLTKNYNLFLVQKVDLNFESTVALKQRGENPFGLPTLEDWDKLWKAWDCVTLSMIPRDLLHTKPIDLRHICLFYLGHIPGFLDIHMSRYLKEDYTEPKHYPDMFERGIDPNMDDPSKVHAHSVVPTRMEDWPSVDEIIMYRDRVRSRLTALYKDHLLSKDQTQIDRRLARTMGMVYEHEAMHLETLLYMCAQIPPGKLSPAPHFTQPDWEVLARQWDIQVAEERRPMRALVTTFPSSTITIGHDDHDWEDQSTAYDPQHTFGWDNETPKRTVEVPSFKVSLLPISNGDYLEFYDKSGRPTSLLPGSWIKLDDGSLGVRVLSSPGYVSLEIAKHWPCMASGKQLAAYAKSVGGRLPSEAELRRYMADNPVDHIGANVGFANWHPVPAKLPVLLRDGSFTGASNGGVWEWTSTVFQSHEGWRASELYPDYSRDFFDGCHWVMLGGSFATIPRISGRPTFTNWYQANYPYVFAGARVAYDV